MGYFFGKKTPWFTRYSRVEGRQKKEFGNYARDGLEVTPKPVAMKCKEDIISARCKSAQHVDRDPGLNSGT
jgi:hypothetical protein